MGDLEHVLVHVRVFLKMELNNPVAIELVDFSDAFVHDFAMSIDCFFHFVNLLDFDLVSAYLDVTSSWGDWALAAKKWTFFKIRGRLKWFAHLVLDFKQLEAD